MKFVLCFEFLWLAMITLLLMCYRVLGVRTKVWYMDRSGETTSTLIKQHRQMVLPHDSLDRVRIIVRRSRILQDTLHLLKNGLDTTKHIRVTFVNEPAVDQGGPLREYFRLLLAAIYSNKQYIALRARLLTYTKSSR